MADRLDGVFVLVLGEGKAGAAVARGLAHLGAVILHDADLAAGRVNLVIIPVTDPGGLVPAALADMDDAEWDRRCEAPLRAMRIALQTAYKALHGHGGRIILLVPTISMNGAEGFAPFSAVGEGARSLAKAAARGWGAEGITVNCLALTSEQLCPGEEGKPAETKVPKALGRLPELDTEIAGFIAALVAGPAILTGATLALDGGSLMTV